MNRLHVAAAVPGKELRATNRFRSVQIDGGTRELPGVGEELQLGIDEPVPDASIGGERADEAVPQSALISPGAEKRAQNAIAGEGRRMYEQPLVPTRTVGQAH